jgi:hypothetical protein
VAYLALAARSPTKVLKTLGLPEGGVNKLAGLRELLLLSLPPNVFRKRKMWSLHQEAPSASEESGAGIRNGLSGSPRHIPSLALGAF